MIDTLPAPVLRAAARLERVRRETDVRGDVRAHTEYRENPIGWIRDKLGVPERTLRWSLCPGYHTHEWDGTPDPLARVLEALAWGRNVGVESATGTGKTFLGACIVLWFLACHEDAIVVTAAPKQDQLKLHIWKEIGRLWPRFQQHFPKAQLLDGKVRMRDAVEDRETWAATAFVCGVGADEASATKAQGFHAEHMLIVLEETPGIHSAIMTAFENTCTAPHNLRLALGNPDHVEDELHRFCLSPGVEHIRVSALDHPNVVAEDDRIVPGAVGRAAIERRQRLYAHLPALRDSRIRGISPEQAVGVALHFDEAKHRQYWSEDEIRAALRDGRLQPFAGIDFGAWRFAFVLCGADRAGRVHVLDELFSQDEDLTPRAEAIDTLLRDRYGIAPMIRVWGDAANPQDIREINSAFRRIATRLSSRVRTAAECVPYRVVAVEAEGKARAASVDRLNDLLGRVALLFRRGLGDGMKWRKGMGAGNEGEERTGSRLLWEIKNWRYPPPREGQAQKQDPDDHTADGADCVAALRYAVMSWWRAATVPEVPEKSQPDEDPGLARLMEVLNTEAARHRGEPAVRKITRKRRVIKRRPR